MLRFFREHLCANNAWVQWKARPYGSASNSRAMKLPGLSEGMSNWKIRHERLNDLHEKEAPRHQKAPSLVSLANWCKLMQIVSLTFCSFAHCAHFPVVSSFITTTRSRCVFRQLWEPFCFGGGPAPCASDVYAVFTSFSKLFSIRFTGKKIFRVLRASIFLAWNKLLIIVIIVDLHEIRCLFTAHIHFLITFYMY